MGEGEKGNNVVKEVVYVTHDESRHIVKDISWHIETRDDRDQWKIRSSDIKNSHDVNLKMWVFSAPNIDNACNYTSANKRLLKNICHKKGRPAHQNVEIKKICTPCSVLVNLELSRVLVDEIHVEHIVEVYFSEVKHACEYSPVLVFVENELKVEIKSHLRANVERNKQRKGQNNQEEHASDGRNILQHSNYKC